MATSGESEQTIALNGSKELDDEEYNAYIEDMRKEQFPMLKDALYLDHAGATLTAKSVVDQFHKALLADLYGNPHSFSRVSYRTAKTIERVRHRLLRFFNADPEHFDLVFTANATAAMKLVAEGFRDLPQGFDYRYHVEGHTSLIGLRELAVSRDCLTKDAEVQRWLDEQGSHGERPCLFAFPAQSNLNGRKLPLEWCSQARARTQPTYTLLDAAALVATAPLDLSNPTKAPDFTVLSLYKVFGFPDLGALIIRKDSGHVFDHRRYFGGGTVDMVTLPMSGQQEVGSYIPKTSSLHERLEDGTLPYHSIIALGLAMDVHQQLFHSLSRVRKHTFYLAQRLYTGIAALRHSNGLPAAIVHTQNYAEPYANADVQGPVVAFNLRMSSGQWVSNTEFEKLAFAKNVNVRTGALCNPGGTAMHLGLTSQDLHDNYNAGHRCGSELDVFNGRPTGVIRASLGAMSTTSDVDRFLNFLDEFYVERQQVETVQDAIQPEHAASLHIESLTIYPIKSCAGWEPPSNKPWPIRAEGLAWDREWCLVHAATFKTLSQKRYPRMALIKPELDLGVGLLRVRGVHALTKKLLRIEVPLDASLGISRMEAAEVCGDPCNLAFYNSAAIDAFFTDCLDVPCRLARFPDPAMSVSTRFAKPHLAKRGTAGLGRDLALSNESPILTITRASLNRLNEMIKLRGGKAASPAVFRANIVLANTEHTPPGTEQPYAEDNWTSMSVGDYDFEFLGSCRRCHMVCIDQSTCEKNEEPLATLAKTRRIGGRVIFGVHTALVNSGGRRHAEIRVGDVVHVA